MRFYLIGYMGSGKSYWGKKWAQVTGMHFIDLDETIEKQENKTIRNIFSEKGESYFRNLESGCLHKISSNENSIIACGGGTPCYHNNMEWMNQNGMTIYLEASPELLANRLMKGKQKRPILMNIEDDKLVDFIAEKLQEREPYYFQAKIILSVETNTDDTLSEIIHKQK